MTLVTAALGGAITGAAALTCDVLVFGRTKAVRRVALGAAVGAAVALLMAALGGGASDDRTGDRAESNDADPTAVPERPREVRPEGLHVPSGARCGWRRVDDSEGTQADYCVADASGAFCGWSLLQMIERLCAPGVDTAQWCPAPASTGEDGLGREALRSLRRACGEHGVGLRLDPSQCDCWTQ